ncbi:MAG: trehalose-binding protein [Desulfovibrio sp.]|nr:trehalose-binding protein [Desulfovibrio sp.]
MNIGAYTFEEFRTLAENFHGYAAPGVLVGAYMVELGKRHLPEGTLFEAVAESAKCLPDAVQLLTACSTGNQRLKVFDLGRYAVTLFDKHTGAGVRVSLDPDRMAAYPELYAWFFKEKPKREQDSARLEAEIRAAADSICKLEKVRIQPRFLGRRHAEGISRCPLCGEAYPREDGPICRGCQGEAPYEALAGVPLPEAGPENPGVRIVPVEEAVGKTAAHDMTRIVPGQFKGPEFRAGQRINAGDVCRLQKMGRFRVAVVDEGAAESGGAGDAVHENTAAEAFARRMAGPGITYRLPPKEGKIDFKAEIDGVFCVDTQRLMRFNLVPEVMAASRHDGARVSAGTGVAGTRAIPLFLSRANFGRALTQLSGGPIFRVLPMRRAKAGILVTGTEVFQGLIEDRFIPVISAKLAALGCEVVRTDIVPDDRERMLAAVCAMREAGVDLLLTTGGMSVDPDDVTRDVLLEAGLTDAVHGVPVLPGAMSLVGRLPGKEGDMQVVGVPACALFSKTTFLDLVLPRLLAGRDFTRAEAARMGEGGYCMGCKICTWPKCPFGK